MRNRHLHAVEQVSRRWREGRRVDSGRTRRKFDFHTGLVEDISCGVPPAPPDVPLQQLGINFDPAPSDFPLDICQGDCDTDDDCKGCLKCFKRSNGEPVPGCSGDVFDPRLDFCYAP